MRRVLINLVIMRLFVWTGNIGSGDRGRETIG
jgi:hypothetical protein